MKGAMMTATRLPAAVPISLLTAVWLLLVPAAPLLAAGGGHGGETATEKREKAAAAPAIPKRKPRSPLLGPELPPEIKGEAARYCWNIADAARDARYLRQKRKLEEMASRLEKLIGRLEKKRDEFETWVRRREAITRRMTTSMLAVYENMEPDVAARQIMHMEYAVAVAILTGMKPQKASAILAEMDPKVAGRLVNVIVGRVAQTGADQPGARLLRKTAARPGETN